MTRLLLSMEFVLRRVGEFWIACDFCDTWYDGKCVQVRQLVTARCPVVHWRELCRATLTGAEPCKCT
jgi:hypothetical protein